MLLFLPESINVINLIKLWVKKQICSKYRRQKIVLRFIMWYKYQNINYILKLMKKKINAFNNKSKHRNSKQKLNES